MNTKTEKLITWICLALFLVINVSTAALYPTIHSDEIMYTDPAVNLAWGEGFQSAAWPSQGKDEFWCSNTPLYSLMLSGWIKVGGFTPTVSRSLNYVLMVLACLLLLGSLHRLRILTTPLSRIGFCVSMLTLFPFVYLYRLGRPDILAMTVCIMALSTMNIKRHRHRFITTLMAGALLPWASLPSTIYTAFVCLVLWAVLRGPFFQRALVLAMGVVLGIVTLGVYLLSNGVLKHFLERTVGSGHSGAGRLAQMIVLGNNAFIVKLQDTFSSYIDAHTFYPYTTLFLFLGLASLGLGFKRKPFKVSAPFIKIIVGIVILTPLCLSLAGKYTWHYVWMHYIPLLALFWHLTTQETSSEPQWERKAGIAMVFMGMLLGLPWVMHLTMEQYSERSHDRVTEFIDTHIAKGEWVVSDFGPYFALRNKGAVVLTTGYGGGFGLKEIPKSEQERVHRLILRPGSLPKIKAKYGGEWIREGHHLYSRPYDGHLGIRKEGVDHHDLRQYQLELYKRVTPSPPPQP